MILGGDGGGCEVAPPPPARDFVGPPNPTTSETVSAGKNEIYQRAPKLQVDFRYTNFLFAL